MSNLSLNGIRAVGSALAGFTFWVLADTTMKAVGHSALPTAEVVGFLGVFIVSYLILLSAARRELRILWPVKPQWQILRALLDLGNGICVVVALRHLPLALFYILVFLSPLAVVLLAAGFLGERLVPAKLLAIVLGFVGVVVAVNPFASKASGDWVGYLSCAVCVVCFSTNVVWSRVLTKSEDPRAMTFFSGLGMLAYGLVTLPLGFAGFSLQLFGLMAMMGLFCLLGTLFVFFAVKYTTAANVSPFHYTQLPTGALAAYLIWGEKPTFWMWAGGVLIAGAGLIITWVAAAEERERRNQAAEAAERVVA